MQQWIGFLYKRLIKYKLHHVFFWVVYLCFWVFVYQPGNNASDSWVNSLVLVSVHAAVSYANLWLLIPLFLRNRHYLSYLFSVLLSVLLGALLLGIVFLQLKTFEPEQKTLIFSFGFILNNFIAIITTVAVTTSLKLMKQWYEGEMLNQKLAGLQVQTELQLLKSQINPHFLFNVLNSLYALSLRKSDKTPEVILLLSEILRYQLYETGEQEVPLKREMEYLRNYVELEKLRFGSRVQVEISEHGALDSINIAPMLLLTFVENAFKHGAQQLAGTCIIAIGIEADKSGALNISVKNTHAKQNASAKGKSGGIGLENVRKRLSLIYPERHALSVDASSDSFEIKLMIQPLNLFNKPLQ